MNIYGTVISQVRTLVKLRNKTDADISQYMQGIKKKKKKILHIISECNHFQCLNDSKDFKIFNKISFPRLQSYNNHFLVINKHQWKTESKDNTEM